MYKNYDKKLLGNVCGSKNEDGEEEHGGENESNEQSEADLLFLI